MALQVTRTQILLPRLRSDIFSRQRLLDLMLDLLDYRVIIVTAPAGYGKTSLLVDFAYHSELPVCWYALDSLDNDPQRFIAHFIAAVAQRFPEFGEASMAAIESSGAALDPDRLIGILVNDAYENIHEHFLFVLDDYHLVNGSVPVDRFVSRFIQTMDENCHLALVSRTLPNLPDLPKMISRSQVGGLSFEELQFRAEEIQSLMLQNYNVQITKNNADELARESEGWITGLLLSAPSTIHSTADRLRNARISGIGLYEYLAEETLDDQPPELREFLMLTSFLEEFDASLCRAVFGAETDWDLFMTLVLQRNLFVLPVGENGSWLRYHHLFRDFLQKRFERENPQAKAPLLQKLAAVYSERGEWEKGYAAILKTGDEELICRYIELVGPRLISNVRIIALREWIDALPWELVASRPGLLSLRGSINVMQGQAQQALELLNQAVEALEGMKDTNLLARTLTRRAVAYRLLGHYEECIRDAERAYSLAEKNISLLPTKAEALRVLGTGYYYLGRMEEAQMKWQEALAAFSVQGDQQNTNTVRMELGLAYATAGKFNQAVRYYLETAHYLRESKNMGRLANLLYNLGLAYNNTGEAIQSGLALEEALECARQSQMRRIEAYALLGIGYLYTDLDFYEPAMDAFRSSSEIAEEVNEKFLTFYLAMMRAAINGIQGDFTSAESYLAESRAAIEESPSKVEWGLWHRTSGRLALLKGMLDDAVDQLEQASRLLAEAARPLEMMITHVYLAQVYYMKGQHDEALAEIQAAFALAEMMDNKVSLIRNARFAGEVIQFAARQPRTSQMAKSLLLDIQQYEDAIPSIRRRLRAHVSEVRLEPPKFIIHTLGRTDVEVDGKPVEQRDWQYQKRVREVFFFLLSMPEGSTTEALAAGIWHDTLSSSVKIQVRNAIYRLRSALGHEVVQSIESSYSFNRKMDYENDAEQFEALIRKGREVKDLTQRAGYYREACDLYCGPYLPDMEGTWVVAERERFWKLFVDTALYIARYFMETRNYNSAIQYCEKILLEDNAVEEAHRMILMVYGQRGERGLLKRQYEKCVLALKELGLKPSSETVSLYKSLINS